MWLEIKFKFACIYPCLVTYHSTLKSLYLLHLLRQVLGRFSFFYRQISLFAAKSTSRSSSDYFRLGRLRLKLR